MDSNQIRPTKSNINRSVDVQEEHARQRALNEEQRQRINSSYGVPLHFNRKQRRAVKAGK